MNLLLLESQAWKFWGETSLKYLQDLCVRIDNDLSADLEGNFDNYIVIADRESEALQNILYLLPTDGGQIPIAFRNENEKNNFSIDDDGFEIEVIIEKKTEDNKNEEDEYYDY